MICFDISLNGERLCIAGKKEATVLTSMLHLLKDKEFGEEVALEVGGMYERASGTAAHPKWIDHLPLKVGDEITIRIVESATADEPMEERIVTPEWKRDEERDYFQSVKAKFESEQKDPES